MSDNREAQFERKSKETHITANLNIDGTGQTSIKTNIGFLDHMLELFAFHGYFDLSLEVKRGDFEIDIHHTNEDIGIVLGKLFKKALDEMMGIRRYGTASAPMESTLGTAVVDICGRGHDHLLIGDQGVSYPNIRDEDGYNIHYLEHFLESFAKNLGATIHLYIKNPTEDLHTDVECCFKALGLALDHATQMDPRRQSEVPSTKGIID
ncbi:MAG: imidazoleglycerol-phosphate dehydratase [Candidatus Omnitrophica bacterium]|nr:imidazoleglycerol-phosphate dehydratase [Candidatus Omnitrophota bacterium]